MDHEFGSVLDHLKHHAGESLQAVIVYTDAEHHDLYRRADVESRHGSASEEATIDAFRRDRSGPAGSLFESDEPRATVRVFADRVVLDLPRDVASGVIVVLDPSAARNLVEFVADIRADVYGDAT